MDFYIFCRNKNFHVEFVLTRQVGNIGRILGIRRIPHHGAKLRLDFLRSSGGGSGMNSSQTRQAPDQVSGRQKVQWKNSKDAKLFLNVPLTDANAVEIPCCNELYSRISVFHLLSSSRLTTSFGTCFKGSWLADLTMECWMPGIS